MTCIFLLTGANSPDKEFLDKAVEMIENELSNPAFSINDFCRAIGMSRTSVYNKIKTLTDHRIQSISAQALKNNLASVRAK
jgi:biotin operon repressor